MAVDTLLRVLTSVRGSPNNPKFRTIDRANPNYVKFVRDKPGAEDMLLAMDYRRVACNNELRINRHLLDDALLYLGITALEQTRTTDDYREGKRSRLFHAEMRRVAKQNGSEARGAGMTEGETAIRLAFLSKCRKEPPEGRGALVRVSLGDDSEGIIEGGRVSRRFDGDDTLEDVLNWLGGCYGDIHPCKRPTALFLHAQLIFIIIFLFIFYFAASTQKKNEKDRIVDGIFSTPRRRRSRQRIAQQRRRRLPPTPPRTFP